MHALDVLIWLIGIRHGTSRHGTVPYGAARRRRRIRREIALRLHVCGGLFILSERQKKSLTGTAVSGS